MRTFVYEQIGKQRHSNAHLFLRNGAGRGVGCSSELPYGTILWTKAPTNSTECTYGGRPTNWQMLHSAIP